MDNDDYPPSGPVTIAPCLDTDEALLFEAAAAKILHACTSQSQWAVADLIEEELNKGLTSPTRTWLQAMDALREALLQNMKEAGYVADAPIRVNLEGALYWYTGVASLTRPE